MRHVKISDKDGRVLAVMPVSVAMLGARPLEREYFSEALKDAVADKRITEEQAKRARCELLDL